MIEITSGFKSFDLRLESERNLRLSNAKNSMRFGVSFLDEALGGIYANDLILLGAKTGCGKTQLATLIALANAKAGKRVGYIALEAEEREIERRIKYRMICEQFFLLPPNKRPAINLNYMDWYYGKLDEALAPLEREIEDSGPILPMLQTYYRGHEFDASEFERITFGMKEELDLIIVDHLHYFDSDDENENRGVKRIVKKIRDVALITGKPIVLIAHMRKSDKRMKQAIPDIEDFHGTSDTPKISTKAIAIAPVPNQVDPKIRHTYMTILKNRVDGARMYQTASVAYNFTLQAYQQTYCLGRPNADGSVFTTLARNEIPEWALSAKSVEEIEAAIKQRETEKR